MIGRFTNKEFPATLYKYRDWNNKYHRKVLSKQQVYFPKPSEFNDPFDGNIPIRWDQLTFEDCVQLNMDLINIKHKNADLNRVRENAIKVTNDRTLWHPDNLSKERPEQLEKWNSIIGLFSLTSTPDNILMWAHYSMNHTGFVVGLDSDSLTKDYEFDYLEPITYKTEYPVITGKDDSSEQFLKKFFSKSELWEYEQEWRISKNHIESRLITLKPETITQVILGCKMNENNQKRVVNLTRKKFGSDVLILKAKMKESEFGLDIEPLE